jgi:hypothetical protein
MSDLTTKQLYESVLYLRKVANSQSNEEIRDLFRFSAELTLELAVCRVLNIDTLPIINQMAETKKEIEELVEKHKLIEKE